MVRGLPAADPRITAFKGIPFAAPPVKENRWRAPQPCPDWEGVLDAYQFGPISVQDTPGLGDDIYCREWHVEPEIAMDEDCLYLNVWTGAKNAEEKLPVLVWFFGGGLQWGYTAEMEMDGERIARRGIVVVTVNYRLNVFGFLAHPELTAAQPDAPANFGSLDQQAGLLWVRRNIAAFGGDPENITIAGQSAGGGSVMAQMACMENEGQFHKAVVMSGMIRSPYEEDDFIIPKKLERAEENGRCFLEYLGVSTIEEARALDAIYIRDKYAEYAVSHPRMATVEDGCFCKGDPLVRIMEGQYVKVPIMAGNTEGEFPNVILAGNEEEYRKRVRELLGDRAQEFLALEEAWRRGDNGSYAPVSGIECTVKTIFRQKKKNGDGQDCYYYRFAGDIPGWDNPGTFHSVDLWFFFETLAKCWRPFEGRHYDLARQMCSYLCNFIKTGNPNGMDIPGRELPLWQPYEREKPWEMIFGAQGAEGSMEQDSEFKEFIIKIITEKLC